MRFTSHRLVARLALVFVLLAAAMPGVRAQVAMPDASQLSGVPLPAPELAPGTISIRLVRERMGNNVTGHDVSVTANGRTQTAATDAQGRAEFGGFAPGTTVVASATVDGEMLVSEELLVPERGGIRVALVAGVAEAAARERAAAEAAAKEPARQGVVVLGGQSRVIIEFQNDVLTVFYLLDITNNARTPIDPGQPLDIVLPSVATNPSLMEGSSRQATLRGNTVRITGPFAPGVTSIQVGYAVPDHAADWTLRQRWPAAFEQMFVAAEKVGDMQLVSELLPAQDVVTSDSGKVFLLASGGRLAADEEMVLTLSNMPAHDMRPRWLAVGLALVVLAAGLFVAFKPARAPERASLENERARLMRELVAIEERRRAGTPKARDAERRPALVADLERVLAGLDEAPGGGQAA